jgi:hypothetical protein
MPILESSVESSAVHYARKIGWKLCLKLKAEKTNGYPDRVFINKHGFHLYIEFKKEFQKPRPLQVHRINELRECRTAAFWTNNLGVARSILDYYLDAKRVPDESYPPLTVAGIGGLIPGSGPGEDKYLPHRFQALKREGSS